MSLIQKLAPPQRTSGTPTGGHPTGRGTSAIEHRLIEPKARMIIDINTDLEGNIITYFIIYTV
jgi:hypothetical protein